MKGEFYGLAAEGWPVVIALAVIAIGLLLSPWPFAALLPLVLLPMAVMKFRDPRRIVPADPLGILSPVDGRIVEIGREVDGLRICVRVNRFGAYLLRSPTEGKVLESGPAGGGHGFRLRTDEGDEVLLRLYGPRWLPAAAAINYGQRVGQGKRCGMLRATRIAEIWLPPDATIAVVKGQPVVAGVSVLAHFASAARTAAA